MGCLIRRGSGIYYGVFCRSGKRVWRSTSSRNIEEAQSVFKWLSVEFVSWERLTILGLRSELLGLLEGKLAASTLRLYDAAFRSWARIVGDNPVRSVKVYHVESFLTQRLREVSPSKVNIDFGCLKAAFNRAVQYGMIKSNPFLMCTRIRIPEQRPYFLSRGDFDCLLKAIENPTIKALVVVAVCTAMRLGELVSLRWENVDLDGRLIRLSNRDDFRPKTNRNRVVPLSQRALKETLSQTHQSEFVFVGKKGLPFKGGNVSRIFKRASRKAGLPDQVHFHSLRHTAASWLVQRNVPISYVKEILGHTSISTTMIYTHNTVDHLRESVLQIDAIMEG